VIRGEWVRANDVRFAHDAASLMMCPVGHWGKHHIIASNGRSIISERKRRYIISRQRRRHHFKEFSPTLKSTGH